ncbi:TPA: hypothetical protein QH890_004829 [Klebsiella oxytoca]|nr:MULTISPECIES: hypothetical protein [Klebsiella]HBM3131810.1 hypothetical protein [Klebsiella michiganensis]ELI6943260.1 hypothetical protein [Klebsiella oxytoca]MBZ7648174.1 hypothetical protein [Klebsiella oxytoca]MDX6057135.1 hypothetical protein [Klebsiella sp. JN_Kp126]HAT4415702.1 hypothetical protein [Klebsiella oxytoca]
MDRWKELNAFPHGCCDLASNFLAQYLQDGDPSLKPVIIHMETTEDFREENLSTVKSHVIVEVTGWFVDLTLNQFAEYQDRVVIDDRTGTVGSLLKDIQASGGTVTKRCIQLDAGPDEDGHELYVWLRDTADNLLTSVK